MMILLISLFALQTDAELLKPAWKPITPQAKSVIRSAVGGKLMDGVTAQYRWPKENFNGAVYCGWVNSKNSYGAYTGFRPFMVTGTHSAGGKAGTSYSVFDVAIYDPTDKVGSAPVIPLCTKAGFDLSGPPRDDPNDHTGAHP